MRSQKEAHQLGVTEIAPEHLLLGLTALERGTGGKALAAQGIDLERVRAELGEPVREPGRGRLPLSREAKQTLEGALVQALERGHNWIGTEHILLALLAAGGRPVELLEKLGATPDALRAEVERLLADAA
jgi:ATP-dependent Clp protease ATP-binding subunit ClpC